jgi:purine-binding chemotaxis protein CheW
MAETQDNAELPSISPPVTAAPMASNLAEAGGQTLDELVASTDAELAPILAEAIAPNPSPSAPLALDRQEQFVIFNLAGVAYAVPLANVTEIERPLELTPVPNVPAWVLGVANLRGDIISVVDLRAFLGLEPGAVTPATRLLMARTRQGEMAASLVVDQVSGIRYLSSDQFSPPTAPIEDQVAPYIRGMAEYANSMLVVLNLERLLLAPEMRQFELT